MKPILFSTKTCKPCEQIKQWFVEHGIEWEEGDLGKHDIRAVPTVIWGEDIISGFNKNELEKCYQAYSKS